MNGTRKLLLPIFFFCFSSVAMGQTIQPERSALQISAGLGIDGMSSGSLFSYINSLFGLPSAQQLEGLVPATEFFVVPEYPIADNWLLGVEYSYLLCSKSISGYYEGNFSESVHMPMMVTHYCMHGEGYWLKLGGGAGYNIGTLKQTIAQIGTEQTYTAHGLGLKLDAVMNLAFDEHLYGMLSGDIRWCTGNTFANGGTDAAYQSESPKLNFVSLGIKLGVMYQF
jgi:hypothetical protein